MTTYSDLIEETRQHLMTGQPDRINVLHANIDNSTTTLTLRYVNRGVSEGSRLVIGLEEFHVIDTSTSGEQTNVTVVREFGGSTAASHTAGDLIYVNPQFSNFRIGQFINQGLQNLSAEGLFRIKSEDFTYNVTTLGYDFPADADIQDIWRVRYDTAGSSNNWPVLRPDEYYLDRAADPTDFASGIQLVLRDGGYPGRTVRVSYRSSFGLLSTLADDVLAVSGLHTEAHDLPPLYASIALLAGREIKRSFLNQQPEPRRAEEVPPGAANQAMRPLLLRYQDRLKVEQSRLHRLYPKAL